MWSALFITCRTDRNQRLAINQCKLKIENVLGSVWRFLANNRQERSVWNVEQWNLLLALRLQDFFVQCILHFAIVSAGWSDARATKQSSHNHHTTITHQHYTPATITQTSPNHYKPPSITEPLHTSNYHTTITQSLNTSNHNTAITHQQPPHTCNHKTTISHPLHTISHHTPATIIYQQLSYISNYYTTIIYQ